MAPEARNLAVYPRLLYVRERSFRLPFQLDTSSREQIAEIILLASADEGKTYEQIDKQPATANFFNFKATEDGMYWFLIQQVDKQGRCTPGCVPPALRGVCVDTKRPSTQLAVKGYRSKGSSVVELNISCKAIDANLDEDSVALEWSVKPDGPWTSIGASELKQNKNKEGEFFTSIRWTKNLPERIHVRLRAKDKAGNVTIDTQSFEIKELPEPEQRP
jgi:hypothetical protein